MPKTRQQKEDTVTKLIGNLTQAKSVVFADYKGMKTEQLEALRSQLSQSSAQFTITKNSLLKIALKNTCPGVIDDKVFEGPIATLFSYGDEIASIKVLAKALKDSQVGSIKGGLLNGEFLQGLQVSNLAQLPSKDELRAKVVGFLSSPLYGIVGVLQANLRNLVYALEQIRVRQLAEKGGV